MLHRLQSVSLCYCLLSTSFIECYWQYYVIDYDCIRHLTKINEFYFNLSQDSKCGYYEIWINQKYFEGSELRDSVIESVFLSTVHIFYWMLRAEYFDRFIYSASKSYLTKTNFSKGLFSFTCSKLVGCLHMALYFTGRWLQFNSSLSRIIYNAINNSWMFKWNDNY